MFTYAGTEVIRAKHHAVMVEPNCGSESPEFLTHRLERRAYLPTNILEKIPTSSLTSSKEQIFVY